LCGTPAAFQFGPENSGSADRAAAPVFGKSGRRVAENATHGTDHGTAAPVFVIGGSIRGGPAGTTPGLTDLEDADLKTHIDFRRVHAAAPDDRLGLPSRGAGRILRAAAALPRPSGGIVGTFTALRVAFLSSCVRRSEHTKATWSEASDVHLARVGPSTPTRLTGLPLAVWRLDRL
jgi:hypothetical protein